MIIDLTALQGRSTSIDIEIAETEIDLDIANGRLTGPVYLKCDVARNGFQATVIGTIGASIEIVCSRCLLPVKISLPLDLEVEFVDKEHFGTEGEHEIDSANLSADALETETLDLNELVREQLLLNLPEQIFCAEDCKGLCEICGSNLNVKDCSCKSEEIDPRWSVLKNLK